MYIVSNFDPDDLDHQPSDDDVEHEFTSERDAEEAAQALADETDDEEWFVWESDDSLGAAGDIDEVEELDGDEFDGDDLEDDEEEDLD